MPFYVVVAFLAGFSERWTRMMLSGAMRTIADAGEEEQTAKAARGGGCRPTGGGVDARA